MRFSIISRRLALSGAILGLTSLQPVIAADDFQSIFFNAPIDFRCADQRPVEPTGYLLALHYGQPASVRAETPPIPEPGFASAVRASVVIQVATAEGLWPLEFWKRAKDYYYAVNCDNRPSHPDNFPALLIRVSSDDDRTTLLSLLSRRMREATNTRSIAPVLFSGKSPDTALIPLPAASQPPTYGALVSGYLARRQDAAFLELFTGSALLQSIEPGNSIINFKRISVRSRVAQADDNAATPQPGNAAAPPPDNDAAPPGNSAPAQPGTAPAANAGDDSVKPRLKRKVQIRLINKSLAAIGLATPGAIETFGYCASIKPDGATPGAYVLEDCVTDDKRQIPIRVAGFAPFVIEAGGNQAIRLDPLLISRTYSVPYGANWQGAATDLVEVQGGPIEEVLKRRITLRQFGLPACEVAMNPTLADIRAETLSFPEPPCRTIDLQMPPELFGKTLPTITEGCRSGSNLPVAASAAGVARCIVTGSESKAGIKNMKLTWAAGFDVLSFNLPTNKGPTISMTAAELVKNLRPTLGRQDTPRSDALAPAYRPVEVRYQVGNQPCGQGPLSLKSGLAPSLADAGCSRLPDRMDLTFEIDREKSDPSVPLEAFKDKVVQPVTLGTPQSVAAMSLDGSRAGYKLPIEFNNERKQRYGDQFARAAELLVAGARVYSASDCSERGGQPKVALFAKSEKTPDFQWPVFAQVFDNEGRALTDCAKSMLERGPDNHAYLTFEFKSTRAAGPRRTIIVARSQDLMDKKGLPRALDIAFANFIKATNEQYKRGAALSPVDILSVSQDGTMRRLFTAEDAALQPQSIESKLALLDRTAPKTPDLSLLRLQPETKGAERVIIIMDGSSATARQVSELRLLASDLAARKGGSLQFYLSSESCALWLPYAPQLRCVELGALQSAEREKALGDAFTGFLNMAGAK
jgi:hypothetical protein